MPTCCETLPWKFVRRNSIVVNREIGCGYNRRTFMAKEHLGHLNVLTSVYKSLRISNELCIAIGFTFKLSRLLEFSL